MTEPEEVAAALEIELDETAVLLAELATDAAADEATAEEAAADEAAAVDDAAADEAADEAVAADAAMDEVAEAVDDVAALGLAVEVLPPPPPPPPQEANKTQTMPAIQALACLFVA